MDAIKLLGTILNGRRQPQGGARRDILQKVLEEKRRQQAAEEARRGRPQQRPHGGNVLEHVLNDVHGRYRGRVIPAQPTPPVEDHCEHHQKYHGYDDNQLNERSVVLIRAMVNAAKADGAIDHAEQDKIISQLGELDREEAEFLRTEFRKPLDIRAFANEVPRGMEEEVYAFSLTAINLDTNPEASYLRDLAECFRIDHATANRIHEHFGAPKIFNC